MSDACHISTDGINPAEAAIARATHMPQMISDKRHQQETARAGSEDEVLAQPTTAELPSQQQEAPLGSLNFPATSNETSAKEVVCQGKKLQYVLRTNPKRSRRFLDPDYNTLPFTSPASTTISSSVTTTGETPAAICNPSPPAPAAIPIKKPTSIFFSEKARACTECGKEFHSWKALFGHMRCHPERQWRGIQPPSSSSSLSPKFKSSPAAKRCKGSHLRPPLVSNDTCGKAQCTPILDESDAESIEAAYMHERDEETSPEVEKGTEAPLQNDAVTCGPSPSPDSESEVIMDEQDMADCLVMLAFAAKGKATDFRFRRDQQSEEVHSRLLSIAAEPKTAMKKKSWEKASHVLNAEEKAAKVDGGAGDSCKSRFQCTSCKKTFRSHQALGGHRASHKKVKGCFARTQAPEDFGAPHALQEIETTLDEKTITETQLDAANTAAENKGEQDDVRYPQSKMSMGQFLQFSMTCHEKMEDDMYDSAATMDRKQLKHQSSSSSSSSSVIAASGSLLAHPQQLPKIHQCTVCHRVFSTGQALGGHKRCHWGSSPASNSSQKGTPSQDSDGGCNKNPQLCLHISMTDRMSELSRRDSCTFTTDQAQINGSPAFTVDQAHINGSSAVTNNAIVQRAYFHLVEDAKDSNTWLVQGYGGAECSAVASGPLQATGHIDGHYDRECLQTGHGDGSDGYDACHESGGKPWQQQKHVRSLIPKEELILDLNLPAPPEKETEECTSVIRKASLKPPCPCSFSFLAPASNSFLSEGGMAAHS